MKDAKETIINSAIARNESVSWNVIRAEIRRPTDATNAIAVDL